ncbi:MAG: FHA domain-containing protein [Victivallaceae bacterium]
MPYIQYFANDDQKIFKLADKQTTTFGREDTCEFQILDSQISRRHFIIEKHESGFFILIDLGSRNGTFLNESRLTKEEVHLHNGDRIKAGNHTFVFWVLQPVEPIQKRMPSSSGNDKGYRTAMLEIFNQNEEAK